MWLFMALWVPNGPFFLGWPKGANIFTFYPLSQYNGTKINGAVTLGAINILYLIHGGDKEREGTKEDDKMSKGGWGS